MITDARMAELDWCWGNENQDPESQEWREGLTEEEQAVIDKWDASYEEGVRKMALRIMAEDQKRRAAGLEV